MRIELHHPLDGYYQGTRFDRSGVFKSLVFRGVELCGPWFEKYAPTMHDAVCGPVEEFSFIPAGPCRLKPGVGLLALSPEPYDRFRLYDVLDPGRWEMEESEGATLFRHIMEPYYIYTKEVRSVGPDAFEIRHELLPMIPWEGTVYNHNFFTFGKFVTGPSRRIDFPFRPEGPWRTQYDSVGFTAGGVRFSRQILEGESVYNCGIRKAEEQGMPYEFTLSEGPLSVHVIGDVPVTHAVLWANHRIACLEPYNELKAAAGEPLRWSIRYELNIDE